MKLLLNFIVLFIVMFSLLTAGCDKATLEKAKSSSAKVASYANTGVNITRDLFRQKFISLAVKDKIADGFISLAKAGQAFDALIVKIEQQYGENAPPQAEIDKIFAVFDSEIVDRLVDILKTVGLSGIPGKFKEVVDLLKSSVIIIAKVFGHKATVAAKLEVA